MKKPRRRCQRCNAGMDAGRLCDDCKPFEWEHFCSLPWGPPIIVDSGMLGRLQHSAAKKRPRVVA